MALTLDYKPDGKTLAAYKATRTTDGDTPFVEMAIRMLSIDAPEVHYPGTSKPSKHDGALAKLGKALAGGAHPTIPKRLRERLVHCLDDRAGTRQLEQGEKASQAFTAMMDARMKTASGKGKRRLFLRSSDEPFDDHGRLLAYASPSFTKEELAAGADRRTFNLQMIEEGWAAPLVIFPSLPKKDDLALLRGAAKAARVGKKGIYGDEKTLAGYEFRYCVKVMLGQLELPERWCADMETGKLWRPEEYLEVQPEDRLFIWDRDVERAKKALGVG